MELFGQKANGQQSFEGVNVLPTKTEDNTPVSAPEPVPAVVNHSKSIEEVIQRHENKSIERLEMPPSEPSFGAVLKVKSQLQEEANDEIIDSRDVEIVVLDDSRGDDKDLKDAFSQPLARE